MSKVIYRFKYTNGEEMITSFSSAIDAELFAAMEGDHLLEYEQIKNGTTDRKTDSPD